MHYYEVAPNQIIRANSTSFTYASEEQLAIGQIVSVEIGKKHVVGVITKQVKRPAYPTKQISSVIEQTPLPLALVSLAQWLSTYYATHFATVLQTILPRGIQKTRRIQSKPHKSPVRTRTVWRYWSGRTYDTRFGAASWCNRFG